MRFRLAIVFLFLPLLCAGCHSSASAHDRDVSMDQPIMQTYTEVSATDAAKQDLSPSDLIAQHQEKGVGLGLLIDGRTFRIGQNIPLLLVYEDVAASRPISSSDCNGFSITIQAVDRGTNDVAPLQPCLATAEPAKNNIALLRGNPRFLHTSIFNAGQELTQPGKYLIRATWQSYVPREGSFRQTDAYARAHSNIIPIVLTR